MRTRGQYNPVYLMINWQELVLALRQQGKTLVEIAKNTGVTYSAIADMSKGRTQDPRFTTGLALIQYAKECRIDWARVRV